MIFASPTALRDSLHTFATKKGFVVSSNGSSIVCSRAPEPSSLKAKRLKLGRDAAAAGTVRKARTTTTTRCGCNFKISFTWVDWKNKDANKSIRITSSSRYCHDNGCKPFLGQFLVEKRKAGTLNSALHETRIKALLAVFQTGSRVAIGMLRNLMKPLFPAGASMDSKLVFDFRLKIKRLLAAKAGDLEYQSITAAEEEELLSNKELDLESPAFFTEALQQCRVLLEEALSDPNDLQQIVSYLQSLSKGDPTFAFRLSEASDGTAGLK